MIIFTNDGDIIQNSMVSQIKTGALLSYISLGVNILIGLLYTPWMIHSIGKDNFGLYTLAMSVISLFVFDLGLSQAVGRFMSKFLAEGNPDKANNILGLVYKLYIVIDVFLIAVLTIVYFFIPQIYESLTPDEIGKLKVVYIIAALFSIISFPFIPLNGILGANEKFIQLKLCELIHKLIIVGAMSVCLLLGYGLYALVAINAIAGLIMIALKYYCVRRFTNTRINFQYKDNDNTELKEVLKFSGWSTVTALAQRMIFNVAPTILGVMSGAASIAVFGVAMTIEGYTYMFASALNGMFLPRVSRIMTDRNGDLLPLMIRVGRIQLLIISMIVLGFICIGYNFILVWVGQDFDLSYLCAVLLILPSVIQLPQEIASTAIVAANKVRDQAIVYVMMAVCNIGLAFWLSKYYGALGISVSICIAYFIRTIGMNYLYKHELNIDLYRFFTSTFTPFILPSLIIVGVGALLYYIYPEISWITLIVKIICLSTVMVLSYWFLAMNREEKALLISMIRIK